MIYRFAFFSHAFNRKVLSRIQHGKNDFAIMMNIINHISFSYYCRIS